MIHWKPSHKTKKHPLKRLLGFSLSITNEYYYFLVIGYWKKHDIKVLERKASSSLFFCLALFCTCSPTQQQRLRLQLAASDHVTVAPAERSHRKSWFSACSRHDGRTKKRECRLFQHGTRVSWYSQYITHRLKNHFPGSLRSFVPNFPQMYLKTV